MTVTIRDGNGEIREDLDDVALIDSIRRVEESLVRGELNEMVLSRTEPERARLIYHCAPDGRYMVTHVDAQRRGLTAIADGDRREKVKIGIGGEYEVWPGDHFIDSLTAGALAGRFLLDGGLSPCVEWRPSTAHR
jgi:hypothetical protein